MPRMRRGALARALMQCSMAVDDAANGHMGSPDLTSPERIMQQTASVVAVTGSSSWHCYVALSMVQTGWQGTVGWSVWTHIFCAKAGVVGIHAILCASIVGGYSIVPVAEGYP